MSDIFFYKYIVNKQVFFTSKHTYALVNIKPLVPGHVLVVPLRTAVLRFNQLSPEESIDYMNTLQAVSRFISWNYSADSMNIAIQDGPESGQSIPHLHTHLIPRYKKDIFAGDSLFRKLETEDIVADFEARRKVFQAMASEFKSDDERIARTDEEMEQEANWLKERLSEFEERAS